MKFWKDLSSEQKRTLRGKFAFTVFLLLLISYCSTGEAGVREVLGIGGPNSLLPSTVGPPRVYVHARLRNILSSARPDVFNDTGPQYHVPLSLTSHLLEVRQ